MRKHSRRALGASATWAAGGILVLAGCGVSVHSSGAGGGAAGPMAGPAKLGGVEVPAEKLIAFLHFGHSNMAGRADGPPTSRPYFFDQVDPHAWMFHPDMGWQPALEPHTAGDTINVTGFTDVPGETLPLGGPGTALVKQAVAMAPDHYFVSLGFGTSAAVCSDFLPGHLYHDAMLAAAKALGGQVTLGAMVVMLGNTERPNVVGAYAGCIRDVAASVRTELGQATLPLLLTDYEQGATGTYAPTTPFAQSLIPQIRRVPSLVSQSALVPTDGLPMQDDHHFNLDGHRLWTQRALDLMKKNGWFPW